MKAIVIENEKNRLSHTHRVTFKRIGDILQSICNYIMNGY